MGTIAVIVGLVRQQYLPWLSSAFLRGHGSPRRALDQFHILDVLAMAIFANYFTYTSGDRFYQLFVPFLCIWGSAGVFQFSRWVKRTAPLFDVNLPDDDDYLWDLRSGHEL